MNKMPNIIERKLPGEYFVHPLNWWIKKLPRNSFVSFAWEIISVSNEKRLLFPSKQACYEYVSAYLQSLHGKNPNKPESEWQLETQKDENGGKK